MAKYKERDFFKIVGTDGKAFFAGNRLYKGIVPYNPVHAPGYTIYKPEWTRALDCNGRLFFSMDDHDEAHRHMETWKDSAVDRWRLKYMQPCAIKVAKPRVCTSAVLHASVELRGAMQYSNANRPCRIFIVHGTPVCRDENGAKHGFYEYDVVRECTYDEARQELIDRPPIYWQHARTATPEQLAENAEARLRGFRGPGARVRTLDTKSSGR